MPNYDSKNSEITNSVVTNGFLKNDPLRGNRFIVGFNTPYKSMDTFFSNSVSSVTVPNFGVGVGELEINDWKYYYLKGRTDGDLRIEFNENDKLDIRYYFTGWIHNYGFNLLTRERQYIETMSGVGSTDAAEGYSITITTDRGGRSDKFFGVFPIDVGGLNYNYNSENEVLKTEVTFKYITHKVV